MTQVQSILDALVELGTSTYDDLERATEIPRNKLRWTCNAMKNAGQIKQVEDSSRHELAWQITPKGRRHHEEESKRPEVQEAPSKPKKQPSETPAAGGANNSRSRASAKPVGQARPRAEGKAKVIEAATRDETPAAPASDQPIRQRYIVADSYLIFENEADAMKHAAVKSLVDNDQVAVAFATVIHEVRTTQHWNKL